MQIKSLFYIITAFFITGSASAIKIKYEIDPGDVPPGKYTIKIYASRFDSDIQGHIMFSVPIKSSDIHEGDFSDGIDAKFDNFYLTIFYTEFYKSDPVKADIKGTMIRPTIKDQTISVKLVYEDLRLRKRPYFIDKYDTIEDERKEVAKKMEQ